MDYSQVLHNSQAISADFLRQRKYDITKEALEWIETLTKLSHDGVTFSIRALANEVCEMKVWDTAGFEEQDGINRALFTIETLPLFKSNGFDMTRELDHSPNSNSDTTQDTTASPTSSILMPTWFTKHQHLREQPPMPSIFQNRNDQLRDDDVKYSNSLKSTARNLQNINERLSTMTDTFKKTLQPFLERFETTYEELVSATKTFMAGTYASNMRRSEAEFAIKGPPDVRCSMLLEHVDIDLDTPAHAKLVGCTWLHFQNMQRDALAFRTACKDLTKTLDEIMTQSYSIWLWAVTERNHIIITTLKNHKAHYQYVALVEEEFVKQLETGYFSEDLSMPPKYAISTVEDSIKVSYSKMTAHLKEWCANTAMVSLRTLNELRELKGDQLGVSSTVVINKTVNLWTKDIVPCEISVDQPLLLQLTWDRYFHLYRSHQDRKPIKTIYALDMKPIIKSTDDETLEVVELQPMSDVNSSPIVRAFRPANSSLTPIAFQFTNTDENKRWKRLIRHATLEQEVVFLSYAKLVAKVSEGCDDLPMVDVGDALVESSKLVDDSAATPKTGRFDVFNQEESMPFGNMNDADVGMGKV